MNLIHVILSPVEIEATLLALGLSLRTQQQESCVPGHFLLRSWSFRE